MDVIAPWYATLTGWAYRFVRWASPFLTKMNALLLEAGGSVERSQPG
jgi:hypothetical protein